MNRARSFFNLQIQEIKNDAVLRIYGCFLSFCHIVSFFNWKQKGQDTNLANTGEPLCWPFFENCFEFRFFNGAEINIVFYAYALCALEKE